MYCGQRTVGSPQREIQPTVLHTYIAFTPFTPLGARARNNLVVLRLHCSSGNFVG